jgi:pimeloyl-ACP methyl ester carboxylesterase
MKKSAYTFMTAVLVLILIGLSFLSTPSSANQYNHQFPYNPIIFVHGGSGSGGQFESQAMRFTSNGYPQDYINVHEYDSSFTINTMAQVHARLDQLIAELKNKFGVAQVDILGHSLGTTVMHQYLANPDRAANVAHYVNIDGRTALAPPGGVPTLALWADKTNTGPVREIVGAWNVTFAKTGHTQAATGAESFYYMYKFFTGKEPRTTNILPEPWGKINLAGRAVYFPQNIGVAGGTVKIYEINGYTGKRLHKKPKAVYSIGEDGNWGPFKARAGEHYEFVIVHPTGEIHPFYYQPFIRSDYLLRLNTSPEPAGGVSGTMERSQNHSNLIVSRGKEFWGDQGIDNDILAINGVNVVNASTCPAAPIGNSVSIIFVFDKMADQVSHPEVAIPETLTFFAMVDLFVPGEYPADGTIRLTLTPRGGGGLMQVLNVPNWASSEVRRISVTFNDFIQGDDIPSDYEEKFWW